MTLSIYTMDMASDPPDYSAYIMAAHPQWQRTCQQAD
ncbi:MAG: hypothetical protein CM15mP46_3880 [Alphaproteobacteria bacterium]|nr:MAG: hypothetical protein CM15mP46_3880 [Alphaproteobacteria bacterium]